MKKLVLVAAVAALFSSCKKDWTCECTYQMVGSPTKTTETYTIKEASRKTAYNACAHTVTTYEFGGQKVEFDQYCEIK